MMSSGDSKLSVVPLKGSNYPTWKIQVKMALIKDGLWGIVDGTEAPPSSGDGSNDEAAVAKFKGRKDKALATIVLSVDPGLLYLLGDPTEPNEVWRCLQDQFQKRTWANKLQLRRRLHSTHLKEGGKVQEHIKALTEIFHELAVVGSPVEEEDRVVHLLASLPQSFNVLVTALEANPEVPPWETVTERLLNEERKRVGVDLPKDDEKGLASMIQKKPVACFKCGREGHIKKNCRVKSQGKPRSSDQRFRRTNPKVEEGDFGLPAHVSTNTWVNRSEQWIVDSGATCHMCNNVDSFESLESLNEPLKITLGDGRSVKATQRGRVKIVTQLEGRQETCTLNEVLLVPELAFNLLSVSKASERGVSVSFLGTTCTIRNKNDVRMGIARESNGLYYLILVEKRESVVLANQESEQTSIRKWHRRLGHLGIQDLGELSKKKMVLGMNVKTTSTEVICEPCIQGKIHRLPFPKQTQHRATEKLALVHTDVCGKMGVPSLNGGEYFLTFIDDQTRFVWIFILKKKSQVFETFKVWKSMVEKESDCSLKVLRSDNGGEFTSDEFQGFLRDSGIRHELTIPRNPEQNGVAERMNRTLVEATRAMLADGSLPHRFWAEVVSTAVYLRNRSPTRAVEGKTPFEAWTSNLPDISHLRRVGCVAYAHVPKEERRKLDVKSKMTVMLGYGSSVKGYRLYDQKNGRVIHSRDVIFDESRNGFDLGKNLDSIDCATLEIVDEVVSPKPLAETKTNDVILLEEDEQSNSELDEIQEDQEMPENEVEIIQRPRRNRHAPQRYGEWTFVAGCDDRDPLTIQEALARDDSKSWKKAISEELESLKENEVWDLVEKPKDRKIVGTKWVFKVKRDDHGNPERYKARLVAKGFTQQWGQDYDETFSPVVRFETIRALIAISAAEGLVLHQMDVATAFLNGEIDEEIYVKQPEGFGVKGKEHLVCRLKKSLYGLKQSPRCWNVMLARVLSKMGFVQTNEDPCLYVLNQPEKIYLAIYVDDLLIAGKSEIEIKKIKKSLHDTFKVKDLGPLNHFLGVRILQDLEKGVIWIGQAQYTLGVLKQGGMDACKPVDTPIDPGIKLLKAKEGEAMINPTEYRSIIGGLLYLSTRTRPDISFAVGTLAKFSAHPTEQHWAAIKRVLRYLRGTVEMGLRYDRGRGSKLVGYSDADWAGDVEDRRSTSGYIFTIAGGPISWRSQKQQSVALSSTEAEYMALSSATQEAIWLRSLLISLGIEMDEPTILHEDNLPSIGLAKNPQYHGRAKHIGIRYHFTREQVARRTIVLKYCASEDMIADFLTKALPRPRFIKLRELCNVDWNK